MGVLAFVAEIVCGESEDDAPDVTMVRLSHEWDEIPAADRALAARGPRDGLEGVPRVGAAMNAIGGLARKN
jgi:hypothetical protein